MIAHIAFALQVAATGHQRPRDHWFGADKLKHFLVAGFVQSVAYSTLQAARVRHDQALAGAWGITAAVSVAKEIHDRRTTGLFSVRDLVWDAAGAAVATVLIDRSMRREPEADDDTESSRTFSVLSPLAPASILPPVALSAVAPCRCR